MKSLAESIIQIQNQSVEQNLVESYVDDHIDHISDFIFGMCEEADLDPSKLSKDEFDSMLDIAISESYQEIMERVVMSGGMQRDLPELQPQPRKPKSLDWKIGSAVRQPKQMDFRNPANIETPSSKVSSGTKDRIASRLSHGWQVRKQVLSTLSPEHHAALKEKGLKASFRKNRKTGKVEMHTVPISHNLKIHPSKAKDGVIIGHASQGEDGKWSPEVYSDVRGEK